MSDSKLAGWHRITRNSSFQFFILYSLHLTHAKGNTYRVYIHYTIIYIHYCTLTISSLNIMTDFHNFSPIDSARNLLLYSVACIPHRGVVGNAFRVKRSYSTPGPVSTAMGDCLRAGKPSRCEACQLGQLSLLPSVGR